MTIVEYVQVATQILTTLTAVVMALFAYDTYLKTPEQEAESEPENAKDEDADESLESVLVFRTSKQKTWLTATSDGLECRIEDIRAGKGGHQWLLSKKRSNRNIAL